ncbi:hypothetical protein C9374_008033 [Naegleria lovaniensis]|uniref:Nudix hydrolase domain-containing protein n=1 Tax=Naegleria lovaniensis TaxID=51637 RepID=A0AA88GKR3_NAELO|nr:uncharacterized protein C9374_008033 [Naegleria lovaniensis]KAG2378885.1 hypothetical protein C9374_008033 [Naegleria lovaniensis]
MLAGVLFKRQRILSSRTLQQLVSSSGFSLKNNSLLSKVNLNLLSNFSSRRLNYSTQSTQATARPPKSMFPDSPVPAVSVLLLKMELDKSTHDVSAFKILMIRRGKPPGKNLLALPGGHLNVDETIREGALRELEEETGIKSDFVYFTNAPIYSLDSIYYHQEENADIDNKAETTNSSNAENLTAMKISTTSDEIHFRKELNEELKRRMKEGDSNIKIQFHFIISTVLGIVIPEKNNQVFGQALDDAKQIQWIKILTQNEGNLPRNYTHVDDDGCLVTHLEDWIDERNHRTLCENLKTIYSMPIVVRHALMRLLPSSSFSKLVSLYGGFSGTTFPSSVDLSLLSQMDDLLLFPPIQERILKFWFDNDPQRTGWWFRSSLEIDQHIRTSFEPMLLNLAYKLELLFEKNEHDIQRVLSKQSERTLLACILMLDQFPRNMYRNSSNSFHFDHTAQKLSKWCLENQIDKKILSPLERMWFYFPLEHSEDLSLQQLSCQLFKSLVEEHPTFESYLRYAEQHRDIIQQFGRFPHRNKVMNRASTPQEIEFLKTFSSF